MTARHFAKRAPSFLYFASRSANPSRPCVSFSPGKRGSGTVPLSTLIPGTMPCAVSNCGSGTPAALFCSSVSSYRMTPLMKAARPEAENSSSR